MDDRVLVGGLAAVILLGAYVGLNMAGSPDGQVCEPEGGAMPASETPEAPPEPQEQEPSQTDDSQENDSQAPQYGNDSEIGKPCSSDSDCLLPYSYAVRSICPYEMRCSEGRCEVFCPWNETGENSTNETVGENETEPEEKTAKLEFFWGEGCPECAAEKEFLEEMEDKYPRLEIISYEVNEHEGNLEYFMSLCDELGIDCGSVPVTVVGNTAFVKFRGQDGDFVYNGQRRAFVGYRNQIENSVRSELGLEYGDPDEWEDGIWFHAHTDKGVYYEKEPMEITAVIRSEQDVNGVYVKALGLKGKNGYYINSDKWAHLKRGENVVVFEEFCPRCFGCGGFEPGEYPIYVWLEKEEDMVAETTLNVEIRDL